MARRSPQFAVLLLLLGPSFARAEAQSVVPRSRILLGDVVPSAPTQARELDLGPTPPAGSSRLITPQEVERIARQAGFVVVPSESVRVFPATRTWTQAELREIVRHRLESELPEHALFLECVPPRKLLSSASAEVSRVVIGQLPHREGIVQTSVIVEVTAGGRIEQRLVVPVSLELRAAPKPVELPQGTLVNLTLSIGSARISTSAVTLQPAKVGTVSLVRVVKTKKTLRAKLLSATAAEMVSQ